MTNKGIWAQSDEQAILSAISRDGKQVAYEWHDGRSLFEVRLIDLDGGKPRVLVANTPGKEIMLVDWSPDGRWIAVLVFLAKENTAEIGLVSTADGTLRVLKSDSAGGNLAFSPDGTYLACDVEAGDRREIHLVAVDGGIENTAVAEAADNRLLGWSPDGGSLVVNAMNKLGHRGVYRVDAQNGDATPVVLSDDRQQVFVRAWSPDGKTISIVRTDPESHREALFARDMRSGQEQEIVRREGLSNYPALGMVALSPDGRQVAFPMGEHKIEIWVLENFLPKDNGKK